MTQRELTEAQLKQLRFALDQSSIVATTDPNGTITYANDMFCKISGYTRDELIGKDHRILNSKYHSKKFFETMWKTIKSGHVWHGIIRNVSKNGKHYWVDSTIVPFVDDANEPFLFLAIRHDVTALKEAEEKILEQQQQLTMAAKLSAIGEMAAAITHEINNPLAVILGRTEMLLRQLDKVDFDKDAIKRIASTIELNGRRIEKIVRSMRSLAHNESLLDKFDKECLQNILEQALDLCAERFKNNGYDLRVNVPSEPIVVECNPTQIFQVFLNLLNNAYDATHKRDRKWLEISMGLSQESAQIKITDCGDGINKDYLDKIFQPFFSTKDAKYGTGLGLSISKGIIERHNGRLYYDHTHPNTRFVIEVPMKQKSELKDSIFRNF